MALDLSVGTGRAASRSPRRRTAFDREAAFPANRVTATRQVRAGALVAPRRGGGARAGIPPLLLGNAVRDSSAGASQQARRGPGYRERGEIDPEGSPPRGGGIDLDETVMQAHQP